ncbi:hypothetical protein OJAV_G00095380 [Oryzias javanicus]|uniref:Uncharacterized protein n=1 Tax=Oryzias javanicus TaxID=123683 RepID=A0A437D1E8_ORYJA|nr:hypothetical protein OJAV_G00095380 [Oryzias javanicus]
MFPKVQVSTCNLRANIPDTAVRIWSNRLCPSRTVQSLEKVPASPVQTSSHFCPQSPLSYAGLGSGASAPSNADDSALKLTRRGRRQSRGPSRVKGTRATLLQPE